MRLALILLAAGLAMPWGAASAHPDQAAHAAATPQAVVDDLLAADRSFATAAADRPAADAIAAMLDEDVVLYVVPVAPLARGKAEALGVLAEAFADEGARLSWAPVGSGVSADGTQGFTYGFTTRNSAGKPASPGKYLAYWVKRPEGWRVAAYKLAPRPDGDVSTAARAPILPARIVPVEADPAVVERYAGEVDRAERAFSDEAQQIGLGAAFRKYGTPDAMNVGGGVDFTYGNDAIADGMGEEPGSPLRWAPDGVMVASSGDLGFTYGYLERNGETPPGRLARIPWFTVWRRASPQSPWRYIAE